MKIVEHPNSVWGDRAGHLVRFVSPGDPIEERLSARWIEGARFEICSIPFFAYNLSVGDIVEAPDMIVSHVVEESGRYVLRIFFQVVGEARRIIDELTEAGCSVELHGRLVAIDVWSKEHAESISGRLLQYERQGILHLETGRQ